ncbi:MULTISPECIES: FlgO family outer membrane protein [Leptospira]|uniref:FlgO family outer membrane protein n=1 Tax=Leptospira TaxID=171 RepID=UPI0010841CB9|nr:MULTISPECIES: FlgO family outer membrane protein [Leptospira]MCG6142742.1 curli production assembly/transport component CsgG domain protein [Leptospira mtsangambouensis]TGM63178.1 curli production assembly/transport component CsgG domain protein [Leptospira meyeri]TGM70611.1 curli production assembly/transport component CsgG domain protein [Leptospira meyeri]
MKKILYMLIFAHIFINCAKPEDIAEMTAPVAFAIANNAIKNGKQNGNLNVNLSFQNLEKKNSDWPSGTITATITTPDSDKQATVKYILNGTYTATAIVEITGKERKQYPINFIESAIVFGQAQTIENHFTSISDKLIKGLSPNKKIAIFDGVGINGGNPIIGKSLSESLVTQLSNKGMVILERKLLDTVLKEINFQNSGLTSEEVRKKLGEFLGADTIIVSTLKGSKLEIIINSRSIDIKSGIVISSAQEILPRYLIPLSDQKGLD